MTYQNGLVISQKIYRICDYELKMYEFEDRKFVNSQGKSSGKIGKVAFPEK